ncbi:hypothetical protein WMY93_018777 [Mugilogobius chulae]|uniref:Uncharacterized protein n=1 Tax=Mugilogobius chulae TaxID=88201 RepID=A0AAW0NL42_9GOBI
MDSQWESLLADIEKKIVPLSLDELKKLSEELKLELSEEVKSSCRLMRRQILSFLESHDVTSLEDGGMSTLLSTSDFIDHLQNKQTPVDDVGAAPEREDADQPQQVVVQHPLLTQSGTVPLSPQRPNSIASSDRNTSQMREQSSVHPMYRKDFRIVGQIGEVGQKDKLNFTCLERQIERGLKKGYEEGEIVEAVIQAIAPDVKLKSYLESSEEEYSLYVPQVPTAHLNPNAPVFRSKVSHPVETQTENLLEEQAQSLDEGASTELSGQVDERLENEEMLAQDAGQNLDTDSDDQTAEPAVPEDTETSSEDEHGLEQERRSTRTRQPRCIFTYDTLGKPTVTVLKK